MDVLYAVSDATIPGKKAAEHRFPTLTTSMAKTKAASGVPKRAENNKYPEIYPANAFIGNYLRLDILMQYGEYDKALENIKGYFYYMAEKTGTLWENDSDFASCNHGFASHVIYWFDKLGMLKELE